MVESRQNWVTIPEGQDSGAISGASSIEARPKMAWFWNGLLTVLCILLGGLGGWYGHAFLWRPSFTNARAEMAKYHMAAEGERLDEVGRICPDEAQAPVACRRLFTQPVHAEVAAVPSETETEAN